MSAAWKSCICPLAFNNTFSSHHQESYMQFIICFPWGDHGLHHITAVTGHWGTPVLISCSARATSVLSMPALVQLNSLNLEPFSFFIHIWFYLALTIKSISLTFGTLNTFKALNILMHLTFVCFDLTWGESSPLKKDLCSLCCKALCCHSFKEYGTRAPSCVNIWKQKITYNNRGI